MTIDGVGTDILSRFHTAAAVQLGRVNGQYAVSMTWYFESDSRIVVRSSHRGDDPFDASEVEFMHRFSPDDVHQRVSVGIVPASESVVERGDCQLEHDETRGRHRKYQ